MTDGLIIHFVAFRGKGEQTQCAAVTTIFLLTSVPAHHAPTNLTIHGFELGLTSHASGPAILVLDLAESALMQSSLSKNQFVLA